MSHSGKIHALLATARIANVPSVISNVWLGVAITAFLGGWNPIAEPWSVAAQLALAGVLIYLSGNFLNDWADQAWDRKHRPERALPRGLFSGKFYLTISISFAIAGLLLAAATSLPSAAVATAILTAVVIYTHWHKRSPWAVIAMGTCRALLPVMGAAGFSAGQQLNDAMFQIDPHSSASHLHGLAVVGAALGLLGHIAGLSLSARYESLPHPPPWISWTARGLFLTSVVLVASTAHALTGRLNWVIIGAAPYLAWVTLSLSIWRKPVPLHVSRLLAGIPWVDAAILIPLALACASAENWSVPFVSACLLFPPLAFISALILQRLAPAT
jgi:hypothetical protein